MKQIIEKLKSIMMDFEKIGFTDNQHTPYFLTLSEARQIVEALEGMEERRAFTLPKGEEVNGSRLCDGRASRHKRLLNHKS